MQHMNLPSIMSERGSANEAGNWLISLIMKDSACELIRLLRAYFGVCFLLP